MPQRQKAKASRSAKPHKPARSSRSEIIKAGPPSVSETIEKVLIGGDLSPLTPEQRVEYMKAVCKSLGLNSLTGPFGYILFKEKENAPEKLVLYAKKDCAEQLRKIHRVSVIPRTTKREVTGDFATTEIALMDATGKTDTATGIVYLWRKYNNQSYRLTGQKLADAIMKSETKAKRRGTLSICGLGILDEMDLESVRVVGGVTPDGRIYRVPEPALPDDEPPPQLDENAAHGHPEGSEKAKQAEAALRRVEEEDQRLREAKAVKPKETAKPPENVSPGPPAGDSVPILRAEETPKGDFIVTGDVDPVLPMIQHYCTWSDFWHCTADKLREMAQLQVKLKFKLEISYVKASGAKGASSDKTTTPAGSPAGSASEPELVKGVIESHTEKMTARKQPMMSVLLKTDKGKVWYSVFDNDLFPFISKAKGREGEFIVKPGNYPSIVGFVKLAGREFVDGKVPVTQRKDQQAGFFGA